MTYEDVTYEDIPLEARLRNLSRYAARLHAENAALRSELRHMFGMTERDITEMVANTRGVGA